MLSNYLEQVEQKQGISIQLCRKTVYCMDNEAFRFLCAAKQGIKFDDGVYENFVQSWIHSKQAFILILTVS